MYGVFFNSFWGWTSVALDHPHKLGLYEPLAPNEEVGLTKEEANRKAKELRGEL